MIPDFPVMAVLREKKSLEGACAVLASDGEGMVGKVRNKLPILALNREGWLSGIAPGWALGRALVRCPELRVVVRDFEAEARLREELFFLAESISADVEMTAEDSVVMDLAGVKGWGAEGHGLLLPAVAFPNAACCEGTALARTGTMKLGAPPLTAGCLAESGSRPPQSRVFDTLHLDGVEVCWAVAETPDLAHMAVRFVDTQERVVSSEDLRGLPVGVLAALGFHRSGGGRTLKILETWGLSNLGDFMALPRQGVAERLGPEAGRWHDVLHGKICRLLKLHRIPESFAQEMDFEEGVVGLDQVVFALKRMLHVLAGRLAARHLAAGALELRIAMEHGGEVMRRLRFPEPQTGVEGMLAPLQTMMESVKLESAVARLALDAEATFAVAGQREWFGKNLPQPERWAETVAKLEAMLGPDRVGVPVREDTFRADAFSVKGVGEKGGLAAEMRADCAVPLRRFRPAREVAVAHEAGGRFPVPLAILTGSFSGEVLKRRGPFLSSGGWWDGAVAWQRLEWDVEVAKGVVRLAFLKPERWEVGGLYE